MHGLGIGKQFVSPLAPSIDNMNTGNLEFYILIILVLRLLYSIKTVPLGVIGALLELEDFSDPLMGNSLLVSRFIWVSMAPTTLQSPRGFCRVSNWLAFFVSLILRYNVTP